MDLGDLIEEFLHIHRNPDKSTLLDGLKLIFRIFDDIKMISKNNSLYRCINIRKFQQKLSNSDIWIRILEHSGFHRSANGTQLVFDDAKAHYLNCSYIQLESVFEDYLEIQQKRKEGIQIFKYNEKIRAAKNSHDGMMLIFIRIDKLMGKYYRAWEVDDYFTYGIGKFLQYVIDEELDDEDISIHQQLEISSYQECVYILFDFDNFPMDGSITDDTMKKATIFYILQCCYRSNELPKHAMPHKLITSNNKSLLKHESVPDDEIVSNFCENANCQQLARLIKILNHYHYKQNLDNIQILEVLDDYLHVLSEHDTDEQFEDIFSQLEYCNIVQCTMFTRNNRNRAVETANISMEHNELAILRILDKIHCHLQHCYDIGNRLTISDKNYLSKNKNNELENEQLFCNETLLHSKHQLYRKVCTGWNSNTGRNKKYNQLIMLKQKVNNNNVYSFGRAFRYGHKKEQYVADAILVSEKYETLKQELTSNKIASVSMEQFIRELTKSRIYHQSQYCKKTYGPILHRYSHISIECILSLMIYCNYDHLQLEFSQTYRENDNGEKHKTFFHLGQNIKISIHKFGKTINKSKYTAFYHGIGEQLLFPQYLHNVNIFGPLSTSTSFEVAANFAQNNGLIVQFGASVEQTLQYFPVFWLSDYPAEKEHLFLQMKQVLAIYNIIDTHNGFEYDKVIHALHII
eukprot:463809_1